MSRPPILYHFFQKPLPYARILALQEQLHHVQLYLRRSTPEKAKDVLLLLEHRPVYTTGRRQTEQDGFIIGEKERLKRTGADFELTKRGGELTYHGPGQVVGYPLLDLSHAGPWSSTLSIRDYICFLQRTLTSHLRSHEIPTSSSEHTGVFLDESTKIASIGVQVRHRLTTHGFAMNVTREPEKWFEKVVACGLVGVKAGSIEGALQSRNRAQEGMSVAMEIPNLVSRFGEVFGREMVELNLEKGGEIEEAIQSVQSEVTELSEWSREPKEL
ncbi:lipoyltransferase [Marasmius fiardii PR-910]|nr:lipoyltransferase [Marasmius fiardii PR-910]